MTIQDLNEKLHKAAQKRDFRRVRSLAYDYLKYIPHPDYCYSLESRLTGVDFRPGPIPAERESELATIGWIRCYGTMYLHSEYDDDYRAWCLDL